MAERESKPSVSGSPLAPVIVDATAAAFSAHGAVMPARLVTDISTTTASLASNPATLSHNPSPSAAGSSPTTLLPPSALPPPPALPPVLLPPPALLPPHP